MKNTITIFSLLVGLLAYSQVGIGIATPDASAAADVSSSNQGILLNKVDLQSQTDVTTIPGPANGMLVYATTDHNPTDDENGINKDNLYYFNGTRWVRLYKKSQLSIDLNKLLVPVVGMYAYSFSDVNFDPSFVAGSTRDIPYADATSDKYVNSPLVMEKVSDTVYKAKATGLYYIDGFINIVQNSTDTSWGVKMLKSSDGGVTWVPAINKANYCNHLNTAGNIVPTTCVIQENFKLNTNDLIKFVIILRAGTINTTARLDASLNRYSSGFKIIVFPTVPL